jgi:hypothetical protein
MSLVFLPRRLLDRLPRVARWLFSFAPGPHVVPLTFKEVQLRRQQVHGDSTDRTPCGCPGCRHARQTTVANHQDIPGTSL